MIDLEKSNNHRRNMKRLKEEIRTIIDIQYDLILNARVQNKDFSDITTEELAKSAISKNVEYVDSVQLNISDIINRLTQNDIRKLCLVLEPLAKFDTAINIEPANTLTKYKHPFFKKMHGQSLVEFERSYLSLLVECFITEYAAQFLYQIDNLDAESPSSISYWSKKLKTFGTEIIGTELEDLEKLVLVYSYENDEISYAHTLNRLTRSTIKQRKEQALRDLIKGADAQQIKVEKNTAELSDAEFEKLRARIRKRFEEISIIVQKKIKQQKGEI